MISAAALQAAADEIARLASGAVGKLAEEDAAKAREIANVAAIIAVDLATGRMTPAEAQEAGRSIVLAARSIVASNGLDILGKRRAAAVAGAQVLLRMVLASVA